MDLKNMLRGVLLVEDDHIFKDNTVGSPLTWLSCTDHVADHAMIT